MGRLTLLQFPGSKILLHSTNFHLIVFIVNFFDLALGFFIIRCLTPYRLLSFRILSIISVVLLRAIARSMALFLAAETKALLIASLLILFGQAVDLHGIGVVVAVEAGFLRLVRLGSVGSSSIETLEGLQFFKVGLLGNGLLDQTGVGHREFIIHDGSSQPRVHSS